jgi:Arc/MetJ-type ribon-helix-helix transcriptional regulator
MSYDAGVARTVQARLDDLAERDLALLRGEAGSDSSAVRLALRESAARRRRRSALRREAQQAALDERDVAASREVMADMEALAPDWPPD